MFPSTVGVPDRTKSGVLSAPITSAALGEPPSGSVKLTLTVTALPASTKLSLTLIVAAGPTLSTSACRDIVDLLVDSVTVCVDQVVPVLPATVREISTGRDRDTYHATRVGVVWYRDLEGIGRRARLGLDCDHIAGTGDRRSLSLRKRRRVDRLVQGDREVDYAVGVDTGLAIETRHRGRPGSCGV